MTQLDKIAMICAIIGIYALIGAAALVLIRSVSRRSADGLMRDYRAMRRL